MAELRSSAKGEDRAIAALQVAVCRKVKPQAYAAAALPAAFCDNRACGRRRA
jgi:hypothetical protein